MRSSRCWIGAILLALPATTGLAGDDPPAPRPEPRASKVRIVLAGDSTVTDTDGWGGAFARRLSGGAESINMARNGRSSRSFLAEGLWAKCLDLKPDYVLIQFGHNDQPGKGPERETDPNTDYRANLRGYVAEARAAGIAPVLVTSLTRRQFGDDGKIRSTLTPYVEVVKEVAAEMRVPLVDLHARSIAMCEALGPEGCKAISPRKDDGGYDGTHLNARGAELVAPLVADALRQAVPGLRPYIKPSAPDDEVPR
jgi:pectinesterase